MIDILLHGDALIELRKLEDNSIDALCVDPPSSINFMGKSWDSDKGGRRQWIEWLSSIMTEVYRVLRPGAHGLVWALPRTSHWTGTALEDAGFEIRDCVYHLYPKHDKLQAFMATLSDEQRAVFEQLMEDDPMRLHITGQGFPKSLDVSKSIDRYFKAERKVIGRESISYPDSDRWGKPTEARRGHHENISSWSIAYEDSQPGRIVTAPATPLARTYQGYGSALKPSVEQWWLIRKPLGESSIAKNVLKWGTGALNIDGCRVAHNEECKPMKAQTSINSMIQQSGRHEATLELKPNGRFPSHLLLSHSLHCTDEQCSEYCPVAVLDKQSGTLKSGGGDKGNKHTKGIWGNAGMFNHDYEPSQGTASRYFAQFHPEAPFIYAPKASRRERNAGCEALPVQESGAPMNTRCANCNRLKLDHEASKCKCDTHVPLSRVSKYGAQNNHPTVKSQSLMKYLLRMITPPNGVILDCFAGSGSTLVAAISEGFHYIGIEQEAEYVEIANCRIQHALKKEDYDDGLFAHKELLK